MAFYRRRPRPDAEKCADPAKARASALETLAGQEVSANMLYERLCRRYTEQAAAAAVAEMVQLDYVNDARYAEARAHSLLAARKSRRAAAQSLRQKGLAPTAKNWPSAAATLWWPRCSAAVLPTPSSRKPSAGWRRGNDPPVKF
uniref:RecX family transcriptional regulator n=1 Tax=Faecalibacterium prausnitzii TaxID=853 RepID=UPI0040285EB6